MTSFDPRRWRRMQPILDQALDLPAGERMAWLDEACAADPELRADLEAVLRADAEASAAPDARAGAVESFVRRLGAEDGRTHTRGPGLPSLPATERGRFLPGTVIADRYRIVSLLGRGGMGEVYRADDLKLHQAVALKFLPERHQRTPAFLHRLLEEAKLARQVAHPNVCRVYDVGEAEGREFLTMEYVDGEDLGSLLTRIGYLPADKALDIARQLCAGLAAAHDLGILHRDLKPPNVMLDGRGRVRITDFGLAVAAERVEGQTGFGTPLYMAPEQLEGYPATARSDVYALGLVMYELFTGRRAFEGSTLEELRRLKEESTPTSPRRLVGGLDPAVERAILRCLEPDPALRPASARALAAALPGGDPLEAAVAAGETPSPELVAAAGPASGLPPAVAFGTLGATLVLLVVLALVADRTTIVGWTPWMRSAEVLDDNARAMLERLGQGGEPLDQARVMGLGSYRYLRYVEENDTSPDRWKPLRGRGQRVGWFLHRQGSRYLVPVGRDGRVTSGDPPFAAGDVAVVTDLRGRLTYLHVEPEEAEPPRQDVPPPDWAPLFREAGLDLASFRPAPPTRNPPVFADVRAAWTGTLPDFGGYPARVEAAARGGRPVFFELVLPWDSYWDPAAPRRAPRLWTPALILFLLVLPASSGIVIGVRNWRSGRGDRRGAVRLAALVFLLRFGVWIVGGHHVPSPGQEWFLLIIALGKSVADAAVIWCLYLAVEPHARRLHPRFLVSWTRLLRGRFADPLVGRDVLAGAGLGTLFILFFVHLHVLIPHALGLRAPPPPLFLGGGNLPYMYFLDPPFSQVTLGGRHVLEELLGRPIGALGDVMVMTTLLLGLRLVLRRGFPALLAFTALVAVGGWPATHSHFSAIGIACGLAAAVVLLAVLRFGLVGTLVLLFCFGVWVHFPVTAMFYTPYFGVGLVGLLAIAALAAYGAFTASRPRRIASPEDARLAA
jgi:eukaryotic-like serine/threonine-protein kinase